MGKKGTDVAREAASLVLLDDNFATIVVAVEEGRRIFDNIRKFIRYILTCNSAEIWTILLAPFLGLPVPLLPIHILWINLVTDGLPGLALAAEPPERAVMQRPPRPPGETIFAHGMWQHILWVGLTMAGVSLITQAYAIHLASAHWQTMVFTVLTLSQMGHVLAIRIGARLTVPARSILESAAARRRVPHRRPAADDDLRSVPPSGFQDRFTERARAGGVPGRLERCFHRGRDRKMGCTSSSYLSLRTDLHCRQARHRSVQKGPANQSHAGSLKATRL